MSKLHWKKLSDTSAQIVTDTHKALATYQWGQQRRHPFFHPVYSFGANEPLTAFAPWDHRWHKGLWWSWKMINGIVFWENATPHGENEGQSHVVEHAAEELPDGSIRITQRLEMRVVLTKQLLLVEDRTLIARPASPGFEAAWSLDWRMTTTAVEPCDLTVTPFPEVPWGGYAGLNYRPNRCMGWNEKLLNSQQQQGQTQVHGSNARWAAYSGNLDGNERDSAAEPAIAGVAMLDHPSNPRHPTPFYGWSSGADNRGFGFLAASFLMHQPLRLETSQQLTLRYRVIPFDGAIDAPKLDSAWQSWAKQ